MDSFDEEHLLLRMEGLEKSFPGVRALRNGELSLRPGECHALMGENGAGKSTLIKILAGAQSADAGDVVCHIATDNYEGGRVAGRAIVEVLSGKGNIAIIDHPEVESGFMREMGFEEQVAKAPDIKIVAKLAGYGARDKSFAVAQDLLQAHPELNAIFAINDPSALGTLAAVEKAGQTSSVRIIGFDGQPEARQSVKDGKLYATVMQYPKLIGEKAIQTIGRYMAGDEVEKQILIPPKLYRQSDAANDPDLH